MHLLSASNISVSLILLFTVSNSFAFEWKAPIQKQAEVKSFNDLCSDLVRVNDPLSKYILKVIMEIQSHMHEGIPAMGIPPLDPLKINDYDFDLQESQFTSSGKLSNILVKHLSTFNVTDIKTSLLHMNVNISLDIPYFTVAGDYKLKGKVFRFFPIYGDGPFELRPEGVHYKIYAYAGFKEGHVHLKSLDFEVFLSGVRAKFDGLMGGGVVGSVLNRILNGIGTTLFHRLEPIFHDPIRDALIKQINKMLEESVPPLEVFDYVNEFLSTCT